MIVQRYKVDGGILIIKTYVKDAKYPFKIQIREVDDIDGLGRIQADNGNVVVNGIELDKYNRPTAYYLKKTDPNGFTNYEIERVEAERVLFFGSGKDPVNTGRYPVWQEACPESGILTTTWKQ